MQIKLWMYRISSIRSGIGYLVGSGILYKMISGIILYPVESHIWYYPVHYQLLSNTTGTDLYGI